MDFIKKIFDENDSILSEKLQTAGFSVDQAGVFLREAASCILNSIQNTGAALARTEILDDPSLLASSMNLVTKVQKFGINSAQVTSGLDAITPLLSKIFSKKNEVIAGSVSSLSGISPIKFNSSLKYLFI